MKYTTKEKEIWNAAVKATINEVKKYDEIITSDGDRKYLAEAVTKKVAYDMENSCTPCFSIELTDDGISVNYTEEDKQSVLELIWSNLSNIQKANLIFFNKTGKTINGNLVEANLTL